MQMATSLETGNGEMIVKRVSVPVGLEELMEGLTKEVILKKPKDIYVFASEYFANLLNLREKGSLKVSARKVQSVTKHISADNVEKHSKATSRRQLSEQNLKKLDTPTKKPLTTKKIVLGPKEDKDGKKIERNKTLLDKHKARKNSKNNSAANKVTKAENKERKVPHIRDRSSSINSTDGSLKSRRSSQSSSCQERTSSNKSSPRKAMSRKNSEINKNEDKTTEVANSSDEIAKSDKPKDFLLEEVKECVESNAKESSQDNTEIDNLNTQNDVYEEYTDTNEVIPLIIPPNAEMNKSVDEVDASVQIFEDKKDTEEVIEPKLKNKFDEQTIENLQEKDNVTDDCLQEGEGKEEHKQINKLEQKDNTVEQQKEEKGIEKNSNVVARIIGDDENMDENNELEKSISSQEKDNTLEENKANVNSEIIENHSNQDGRENTETKEDQEVINIRTKPSSGGSLKVNEELGYTDDTAKRTNSEESHERDHSSSFNASKLHDEILKTNELGQLTTFRSSYNPYILRQEVKKAAGTSTFEKMSKMTLDSYAATKIQSMWRGFQVRKRHLRPQLSEENFSNRDKILLESKADKEESGNCDTKTVTAKEEEERDTTQELHDFRGNIKEQNEEEIQGTSEIDNDNKIQVLKGNMVAENIINKNIDQSRSESKDAKTSQEQTTDNLENKIEEDSSVCPAELESEHCTVDRENSLDLSTNKQENLISETGKEATNEDFIINGNETNTLDEEAFRANVDSEDTNAIKNETKEDQEKTFKLNIKNTDGSQVLNAEDSESIKQKYTDGDNEAREDESSQPEHYLQEGKDETDSYLMDREQIENTSKEGDINMLNNESIDQNHSESIDHKQQSEELLDSREESMAGGLVKSTREESLISTIVVSTENDNTFEPKTDINDNSEVTLPDKNLHMVDAVLKIQAMWRGFKVRQQMGHEELFGSAVKSEITNKEQLETIKKENAALKIQSSWREYKLRNNMKDVRNKLEDLQEPSECDELPTQRGLTDEEIFKAATKIQAGVRGYIVRKKRSAFGKLNSITEETLSENNSPDAEENVNVNMLKSTSESESTGNKADNEIVADATANIPEKCDSADSNKNVVQEITGNEVSKNISLLDTKEDNKKAENETDVMSSKLNSPMINKLCASDSRVIIDDTISKELINTNEFDPDSYRNYDDSCYEYAPTRPSTTIMEAADGDLTEEDKTNQQTGSDLTHDTKDISSEQCLTYTHNVDKIDENQNETDDKNIKQSFSNEDSVNSLDSVKTVVPNDNLSQDIYDSEQDGCNDQDKFNSETISSVNEHEATVDVDAEKEPNDEANEGRKLFGNEEILEEQTQHSNESDTNVLGQDKDVAQLDKNEPETEEPSMEILNFRNNITDVNESMNNKMNMCALEAEIQASNERLEKLVKTYSAKQEQELSADSEKTDEEADLKNNDICEKNEEEENKKEVKKEILHIEIPLRRLSEIKEEDTSSIEAVRNVDQMELDVNKIIENLPPSTVTENTQSTATTEKVDPHQKDKTKISVETLESAYEGTDSPKDEIKMNEETGISLIHSGEFHDTITVSLPVTPPTRTSSRQSQNQIDERQTTPPGLVHSGELHDNVLPLSVQLNDAPPAGAEVLTSCGSESVSGNSQDGAQASNKDASTCGSTQSDSRTSREVSMETEKRNNATLPKKNLEVEAATKIQAGFRGYKVRKQLKNKIRAPGDISNQRHSGRRKSSGRLTDSGKILQNKGKTATDVEEKSAVKIQASVRGFLVRRRQKKQKQGKQ